MIRKEEVYKIGVLGKPHGVKGEINFCFTDDVFDRVDADYLVFMIDGIFVPFYIEEYRFRGTETALIKFCDIDNAEKAHQYSGVEVWFPIKLSDSKPDEDMNWEDFCGYTIINTVDEKVVGTVSAVDDSTANVLFEVVKETGANILIPASENLVKEVNVENKTVRIEIPEGLLNLDNTSL